MQSNEKKNTFYNVFRPVPGISWKIQLFQEISAIPLGRSWEFFERHPRRCPNIFQKVPLSNYQCPDSEENWPKFTVIESGQEKRGIYGEIKVDFINVCIIVDFAAAMRTQAPLVGQQTLKNPMNLFIFSLLSVNRRVKRAVWGRELLYCVCFCQDLDE